MLIGDNPAPISSLSGRLYSTNDLARLRPAMGQSRRSGKPLVIGEFGVPGAITDATQKQFRELLDALDRSGVPLAALWVFDFAGKTNDWNVTTDDARREQLRWVAGLNASWRSKRSRN